MKDHLKEKISHIVDEGLSNKEIEEVINFLRQTIANNMSFEDNQFFRNMTYEMTGQVKELALLIIDFKKDLQSKIDLDLTDIATKYIPQATDQLEAIIETTENAANKIMDNMESLQADIERMGNIFASLRQGAIIVPGEEKEDVKVKIDSQTKKTISPLIDYIESSVKNYVSLISDSFIQMSFQDLTGQRIKCIIKLIRKMEEKIADMVISFGIRLTEIEKNPDISQADLQRAVDEKVTELSGPQKEGQGLDQSGIDDLLANL